MYEVGEIDISKVTHLFVGFSSAFLSVAGRKFSAGQVIFVEEPEVARSRSALECCAAIPAVAGILERPIQDEGNAELLPATLSRPPGLRAVIPGGEYGVVAAAALAAEWDTPGAGLGAARILRDKAELRACADIADIRQPGWAIVDGPAAIDRFRRGYDGRCVVKPSDRQGSLGVALIGPADDAGEVWAEMIAVREPGGLRAREELAGGRYLAEERITGAEVSVEALVAGGTVVFLNITGKDVRPGRYPVELGHTVPASVSDEMAARLAADTGRLMAAVNFQYGMIHAEWIIADREPYLIECAARAPGDRITDLIDYAYGTRIMDALLLIMAGEAAPSVGGRRLAASIQYLTAEPGTVTRVTGADQAWDVADVVDVAVTVSEGDVVRPLRAAMDRVGAAIAVARSPAGARESAAAAIAALQVLTKGLSRYSSAGQSASRNPAMPAGVGSARKRRIGTLTPNRSSSSEMSCTAPGESPPASKKSSFTAISAVPSTPATIAATARSRSVMAARLPPAPTVTLVGWCASHAVAHRQPAGSSRCPASGTPAARTSADTGDRHRRAAGSEPAGTGRPGAGSGRGIAEPRPGSRAAATRSPAR
jgi:biotin carboxylase